MRLIVLKPRRRLLREMRMPSERKTMQKVKKSDVDALLCSYILGGFTRSAPFMIS